MHKRMALFALILGIVLCVLPLTRAQEAEQGKQDAKQDKKEETKPSEPRPIIAYRLDIAISELEDGKKINSRHYSINTTSDSTPQMLRIGTKVPVQNEEGKVDYVDVSTRITERIAQWVTPATVNVHADISSFATPDDVNKSAHPLLRNVIIEGTVPIVTGKPVIVGTVDDPASKRQFQLEVTATKLQ